VVFAAHCYALCAAYAVAVSVCPSVTFVDHVKMNKRKFFHHRVATLF